ncbi:pilin/secretion family protein with methylation motif [Rossellomorea aquimaris]|uniref:Pilin/secretion family protein with methylation motif n=2 Tax=Rossellomorea aquimaris TaxID=189382 RepID=A0A366EK74_9BACI|nr:pilin/secretion family protein with methylation motif [Rossellomorea aquimaris]
MTQNEKGITLLEVLLSMVILSIVLLTIVNFFPQMGRMNTYNGEKMKAVNVARGELAAWKESDSLDTPPSHYIKNEGTDPHHYHYFTSTIDGFKVKVTIDKQSDLDTTGSPSPTKAHQLLIQVLEDQKIVSETYGYIMVHD